MASSGDLSWTGSVYGRLYHGIEKSATSFGAPSSEDIERIIQGIPGGVAALSSIPSTGQALVAQYLPTGKLRGKWAGPQSRITRRLNTLSPSEGFITHATNVWIIPTTVPLAEANKEFELIGQVFSKALLNDSADWSTQAMQYNPNYHGTVSWWANQSAARTRYRDEWPEMAARLSSTENPIGPNSPDVRAPTAGEVVGTNVSGALDSTSSSLKNLVIWGGLAWLGFKLLVKD